MPEIEIKARQTNTLLAENRIGLFEISDMIFANYTKEELLDFMSNFAIVHCKHRYDKRRFEYAAYSPLFEPVKEGHMIPSYLIRVSDGRQYSAEKQ